MAEKLIRDGVPAEAAARGVELPIRVADDSEMWGLLMAKLREETAELENATTDEERAAELGDVVEVALALGARLGLLGAYQIASPKYRKLGGFTRRFVLRMTDETRKA